MVLVVHDEGDGAEMPLKRTWPRLPRLDPWITTRAPGAALAIGDPPGAVYPVTAGAGGAGGGSGAGLLWLAPKSVVHQIISGSLKPPGQVPGPTASPMPISLNAALRMFARWPELFIQ